MSEIFTTESIARGIAATQDVVLYEKPMSRLVFRPKIHNKGIRGKIIRQRRESKNDSWIPDQAINIRDLEKNETINIELNTEAINKLYSAIQKLAGILKERGVEYGTNQYAVVNPDSVVIADKNRVTYIKKILEGGYSEEIWASLVESYPSLATKLSYARIQTKKQEIVQELGLRLQDNNGFHETKGKVSWQEWIYKNNWLFGVNYREPIEKTKINISGIMPDFLFPTIDGFVDILEIKLPNDEVIIKDKSHSGAWKWTTKANEAIGQMINYLGEIDRTRLEIEKAIKENHGYDISLLKPRAYILIGNSTFWEQNKKEGLRKMNHALHGIEILTYKDLIDRGEQAASYYKPRKKKFQKIKQTMCPQ